MAAAARAQGDLEPVAPQHAPVVEHHVDGPFDQDWPARHDPHPAGVLAPSLTVLHRCVAHFGRTSSAGHSCVVGHSPDSSLSEPMIHAYQFASVATRTTRCPAGSV